MKYRIEYTSGNGYTCSCCSRWSDETIECDNYNEAIDEVAKTLLYHRGDGHYNTTVAIPESPDDFIKNDDGTFDVKFDLNKFELEARQKSEELKIEREIARKNEEEQEIIEQKKEQDERDKKEYERLKSKFEK